VTVQPSGDEVSFGRAARDEISFGRPGPGDLDRWKPPRDEMSFGPGAGEMEALPDERPMDGLALATRGLSKRFRNGQLAVDNLDLSVPAGSVYGFLGPNGSGKTTTIRMLLGLIQPTSGTCQVLGFRVPDDLTRALSSVGALVEGPAFYPQLYGGGQDQAGPRPRRAAGCRRQAVPGLLPGHEAAAGDRLQPAAAA
jgi:hypothetical protein